MHAESGVYYSLKEERQEAVSFYLVFCISDAFTQFDEVATAKSLTGGIIVHN